MDRNNDIKMALKNHGFTLAEVADKLGISKQNFGQRISTPTFDFVKQIAEATGITPNELAGYTDKNTSSYTCPYCGKRIQITLSPKE